MLALYFDQQRREREALADALEAEARAYQIDLIRAPAPTGERQQQVQAIVTQLFAQATKLREPPNLPQATLTHAQQVVMNGRFLPPVQAGG